MRKSLLFVLEFFKIVVLALVIVIPIRYFVFQPFIVKGASMEPTFHDGDYLIVDEFTYHFKEPQRGEVVVFRYPQDPSQRFIKRIVGLPGEQLRLTNGQIEIIDETGQSYTLDESDYVDARVWLADQQIKLDKEEYFVLGDNRLHSFDSRKWGVLRREYIVGRVILRAWPIKYMAFIAVPSY